MYDFCGGNGLNVGSTYLYETGSILWLANLSLPPSPSFNLGS